MTLEDARKPERSRAWEICILMHGFETGALVSARLNLWLQRCGSHRYQLEFALARGRIAKPPLAPIRSTRELIMTYTGKTWGTANCAAAAKTR